MFCFPSLTLGKVQRLTHRAAFQFFHFVSDVVMVTVVCSHFKTSDPFCVAASEGTFVSSLRHVIVTISSAH